MRLVDLLATLDDETLDRLARTHLGAIDEESRAARCLNLESELRSPKRVRDTVFNLQPPAFRILEVLLESTEHSVALAGLRERAMEETIVLADRVSTGSIVSRAEAVRV